MDPAGLIPRQEMDASQIHHALSHQGALVGQHSQALQQLMTSMQELTSSVAQIGSQLAQVSSLMVPPAAQPNPLLAPPEPPVPQSREPRVPTLDRYSGELGLCRAFLIQYSLVFEQQPLSYPTDRNALAWASAVWDNQSPLSQSFVCFTTEMGRVFDHPVRGSVAANHLLTVRQGSRSMEDFAVEFRITAAETGWNDEALQGAFKNGLCDRLKDELAPREDSGDLNEIITLVIRLDTCLRERQRERARRAPSTSSSRFSSPPNVSLQSPLVSPFTSSNTTSHRPTEEPMHLGRARLSPAECTRRMQAGVGLTVSSPATEPPDLTSIPLVYHDVDGAPVSPDTIVPSSCIVTTVNWEIESAIRATQQTHPDPVKEKFSIPVNNITVEDDSGTEVDETVFAELSTVEGMLFVIKDDQDYDSGPSRLSPTSTPQSTFSGSSRSSVSISSSDGETPRTPKRLRSDEEACQIRSARDLIQQILQTKPGGITVLEEYEETGTLCDSRRRQMINILAAHMVETVGRIPQRQTKEKYALGIVTLFPALKDPLSKKGYEHFYDSQGGSGFLAWRLKTIQRKTKLVSKELKTQSSGGGPRQERELPQIGSQMNEEHCKEAISLMNHTSDREIILQKMKMTFEYRQRLIHNPDESHNVLSVFPRLLDTKGLIPQDFIILFGPETAAKLLERWHTCFKRKVISEAESLTTTPVLQSLLKSARNQCNDESSEGHPEWDSDMASFLLLLHILPPQPSRKQTQKISRAQAMDHLVVFHKSCRSLEDHLENQEGHRQPYLLASGTHKQAISTYYIVMDKKLIPCLGTTSLAALDELFKVHFVFSVSYDNALSNMYTFLQTTVYGIDVENTKESPKVKELRAKFMNSS
ncbi:hypothetical protein DPEC_G00044840 [Dallia pectoralis]|uniref:Uncharacterized protein n=1 Tax=Dallia pectoralis TaxID=75939 RepID=A0ACC2HA21_DALPE|nr:hypothetical protein DPEC_G00044840 [Dallia pectoralis]